MTIEPAPCCGDAGRERSSVVAGPAPIQRFSTKEKPQPGKYEVRNWRGKPELERQAFREHMRKAMTEQAEMRRAADEQEAAVAAEQEKSKTGIVPTSVDKGLETFMRERRAGNALPADWGDRLGAPLRRPPRTGRTFRAPAPDRSQVTVGVSFRAGFGYDTNSLVKSLPGAAKVVGLPGDPKAMKALRKNAPRDEQERYDRAQREQIRQAQGQRRPRDASAAMAQVSGLFIPGGQDRLDSFDRFQGTERPDRLVRGAQARLAKVLEDAKDPQPEKADTPTLEQFSRELLTHEPRERLSEDQVADLYEKWNRERFEQALIAQARLRGMPTLAVCGGSRSLARGFGVPEQDLTDTEAERHQRWTPDVPAHPLVLRAGSRLGDAGPALPTTGKPLEGSLPSVTPLLPPQSTAIERESPAPALMPPSRPTAIPKAPTPTEVLPAKTWAAMAAKGPAPVKAASSPTPVKAAASPTPIKAATIPLPAKAAASPLTVKAAASPTQMKPPAAESPAPHVRTGDRSRDGKSEKREKVDAVPSVTRETPSAPVDAASSPAHVPSKNERSWIREQNIDLANSTHAKVAAHAAGRLKDVHRIEGAPGAPDELVISATDDRHSPEGFETSFGAPILGITSHPEAVGGSTKAAAAMTDPFKEWSANLFSHFAQASRAYAARQRVLPEVRTAHAAWETRFEKKREAERLTREQREKEREREQAKRVGGTQ